MGFESAKHVEQVLRENDLDGIGLDLLGFLEGFTPRREWIRQRLMRALDADGSSGAETA